MNMRRKLFAVLAAGMMLLTVGGTASAHPSDKANCTAGEAVEFRDISFFARLPHPGERSFVGFESSENCGSR